MEFKGVGEPMETRSLRRVVGMLAAGMAQLPLTEMKDPRARRGRRWSLSPLLSAVMVGMAAGCKSLAEVEALTAEMSPAMRRKLGLRRRVPDTTLHDLVSEMTPDEVRALLHAGVRQAHRRKALGPVGLPFGVVAMDGKASRVQAFDDRYAQKVVSEDGRSAWAVVRTLTSTLVTSQARVCLDAWPIPAGTNEMGAFHATFVALCEAYGSLFRVITYDAGACSRENAEDVIDHEKDYLFSLKENQPNALWAAKRRLKERTRKTAEATTVDVVNNDRIVTRRLYTAREHIPEPWLPGLKLFVRVESETTDADGNVLTRVDKKTGKVVPLRESRYFATSMRREELEPEQWLLLVRAHWSVEECHKTWDVAFDEDERRWIPSNPRASVVVQLFRRVVYNMLALFRSVTQRSEEKRGMPWRDLLRWVYNAVIAATEAQLDGLRPRKAVAVCC